MTVVYVAEQWMMFLLSGADAGLGCEETRVVQQLQRFKIEKDFLIGLLLAGLLGSSVAQSNLSFESGGFSGWNMHGKGWSINNKAVSDGSASAECAIAAGDEAGLRACAQILTSAAPGKIIKVSLDVATVTELKKPNSTAYMTVACTGSDGQVLKEYRKDFTNAKTTFRRMTLDNAVVPPGTAETHLMIIIEIPEAAKGAEGWRFDNVKVEIL